MGSFRVHHIGVRHQAFFPQCSGRLQFLKLKVRGLFPFLSGSDNHVCFLRRPDYRGLEIGNVVPVRGKARVELRLFGGDDIGDQVSAEFDGRIRRGDKGLVLPAFRLQAGKPNLQAIFLDRQI